MKPDDDFRSRLDHSDDLRAEQFFPVNGERVRFYKNDVGMSFLVQLEAARAKDLSGNALRPAGAKRNDPGYYTIAQIRDGSRVDSGLCASNRDLEALAEAAVSGFNHYVDSWGHWPSFQQFLEAVAVTEPDPKKACETQLPLDYFWLVGNLGTGEAIFDITLDEGIGIFVRPDNGVLPVYASELAAALSAEAFNRQYGLNLRELRMPCLGCYLHGAAVSAEEGAIKYGLLNDQWPIHFLTCEQCGCVQHLNLDEVRHFRIVDQGRWYDLRGCESYGQNPRWFVI